MKHFLATEARQVASLPLLRLLLEGRASHLKDSSQEGPFFNIHQGSSGESATEATTSNMTIPARPRSMNVPFKFDAQAPPQPLPERQESLQIIADSHFNVEINAQATTRELAKHWFV